MMEPYIRHYDGVDLTRLFPEEALVLGQNLKECWERMMMEYSASIYFITYGIMVIERSVRRDRVDPSNVFSWE